MNGAKKGATAEREVMDLLNRRGYDVRREGTKTFGRFPDLYNLPGLHLEIKRAESLRLPAWIAQSERDAAAFLDGVPVVIFRQNWEPWRIVLRLEDFMDFYEAVHPPKK
jgi:Holliday junction resolvase